MKKLFGPDEQIFQECLLRLEAGEDLDKVLAGYPQRQAELRPLLLLAMQARQAGREIQISTAAQNRSLTQFLGQARNLPRPRRSWFAFLPPRLAYTLITLLLVVAIGTGSAFAASTQALPGDALYPLKVVSENTRLKLTRDPLQRYQLERSIDQERQEEVESLIQAARSTEVDFTGPLTAIQSQEWTVSNVRVILKPGVATGSLAQVGYLVEVHGFLQKDGSILADLVQVKSFQVQGKLQSIKGGGWTIGGIPIQLNPEVAISGKLTSGSLVAVNGYIRANGDLEANQVQVLSAGQLSSTPVEGSQPTPEELKTEVPHQREIGPLESSQPSEEPSIQPSHKQPEVNPTSPPSQNEDHSHDSEHSGENSSPDD